MTLEEIRKGSVLLFDKPFGWSSFDVVNKVKRMTKAKTGHAGTLDPNATGLLILCTGSFTKRIPEFQDTQKEYTGTMILGATTPSYDTEKEIDRRFDTSSVTTEMIYAAIPSFMGEILQSPPNFSAIYVDGRRAYKKARSGHDFEIEKRKVTLFEFEITGIEMPAVHFRIICGKGFYVRSLVNDFGKALNNGAYLSALCRTRIGNYLLQDAWQVDDFTKFVLAAEAKEAGVTESE
ncbi:MAG: tRNA pseudouridine(55) synthase TruB [Chitinophagales bacterium]|nr:tRNA pseudouridine(55) synthase TruB [Chitinophagales bacterium]